MSIPGHRKKDSSVQVLQVHKGHVTPNQEDDYLPDGIYVCHAPLSQTLEDETWINNKQIDALIVGPDCSVADIESLREIASREFIPLVFHTLKFDWKAKEISIEGGVDEYHIGFLDEHFIKRIRLIKRVKSFLNANGTKKNRMLSERYPYRNSWLMKRLFDITVATLILLSLLPILLLIVLLLLFETDGPIFSSSKRVGKNCRTFRLYKFRCLSSGDGKGVNLIRKFLKMTHLIGLPQLFNVLVGDMSLVGNYPIHENDAEQLTKDEIVCRFLAPAGITGLWRFRPDAEANTDICDRAKPDIEYAKTNSFWLDIRILFVHLVNVIAGQHRVITGLMASAKASHSTQRDRALHVVPS